MIDKRFFYRTIILNNIPINGQVKTLTIKKSRKFEDVDFRNIHSSNIMDMILYTRPANEVDS